MSFDKEFLKEYDDLIKQDSFTLDYEYQKYCRRLELSFPFSGSKIDWDKTEAHVHESNIAWDLEVAVYFFVDRCLELTLSEKVIYINDSALDFVVTSDLVTFKNHIKGILELPDHHYFVSVDYSWCMAFTMEGDMDFALSRNSSKNKS